MATLISKATGNFTDSATWALVANERDQETAIVAIGTSALNGTAFTPGAIDVDGMAVKLATINNVTGTFTVELFNTTDSVVTQSVTVNVSDLPPSGTTWLVVGFSTITLTAGKSYTVRTKCSTSATVSIWRGNNSAADWLYMLRSTTQQSPAASDKLIITGDYTGTGTGNSFTVTMNNTTTTSFGPTVSGGPPQGIVIGGRGTLTYGTAASTDYYLKLKGIFLVGAGGTFNIGTLGDEMPFGSTAVLEFDCVANVDSGLIVGPAATYNFYGAVKTPFATYLTSDKSAGATTLDVFDTADWLVGDELAIASTSRTAADSEKKSILTVDSSTSVTLTAGLTNAHLGTGDTQAEVINLTRNIKIRGISTSLQGFVQLGTTATVSGEYVEFYNLGSATSLKRGIDILTTTGSANIRYCSFHDFVVTSSIGILLASGATNNVTISNCVLWNINVLGISVSLTSGTWTITNCVVIGATTSTGFSFSDLGGTFTDCTAAGCNVGILVNVNEATVDWTNLTVHSNVANGCQLSGMPNSLITNLVSWRNNGSGILLGAANGNARVWNLTLDSPVAFGNATSNFDWFGGCFCAGLRIINPISNGDSTFSTSFGLRFQASVCCVDTRVEGGSFSVASGIKTAHTNDVIVGNPGFLQLIFHDTILTATTELAGNNGLVPNAYVRSQKHDGVAGAHKAWYQGGIIDIDGSTYKTASPAERLTPNSASVKLEAGTKRIPVGNGAAVTPTVYVNKSGTYNGNQPRLVLKKNVAAGIDADTVLATASGGTGSWLTLSGQTDPVTDDAVLEFVVDCDGTAGTCNVDDWSAVVG